MSTPNINDTNVKAPDALDYSKYDSGEKSSSSKVVVLPPKGTHKLQTIAVECRPDTRTAAGYLKATLTVKTIAPGEPWDQHEIRFVRISTKKYSNREANSMADYLRACGIAQPAQTDAEYVALVNRTVNSIFEGGINWEAQDPDTHEDVASDMNDFPVVDGKRLQYLKKADDPQGRRMWARARITYFKNRVAAK